jgi:hypothetical protein
MSTPHSYKKYLIFVEDLPEIKLMNMLVITLIIFVCYAKRFGTGILIL